MVRVGEAAVIRGVLAMPRVGVWHADFDLDAAKVPEGKVEITIAEELVLKGTVTAGGPYRGGARVRIGAGADGLRKQAKPRHYVRPVMRTVLTDLAAAAGETLSSSIPASILNRSLESWAVLGLPVGVMLAALALEGAPEGTAWRVLADGTIWMGPETWPASKVKHTRELDRSARDAYLELGLDAPLLQPGTMLGDDRLSYVEHHIDEGRVWARLWLE